MNQFIASKVEYFITTPQREIVHDVIGRTGLGVALVAGGLGLYSMFNALSLDSEASDEIRSGNYLEAAALYDDSANEYGEAAAAFVVASVSGVACAAATLTHPALKRDK